MSQPTHIEKVAIIGVGGHLGQHFVDALQKTGKHTITAITRQESTASIPSGLNVARVDYSNPSTLVSALKGQQFLVITLSVRAPPDLHSTIIKAAIEAGVPYIMPNTYGYDFLNSSLEGDQPHSAESRRKCEEISSLGATYIAMSCGFWYEWSIALGEQWCGFTIPADRTEKDARKVTFFDDGNTKISTSTWLQCGQALAALLSLPIKKEGSGPALEDWKNKQLFISSFLVSQRDMLDSLNRILGTKDSDWEIKYEGTEKRVKDGQQELANGDFRGFAKSMYSRVYYPTGDGNIADKAVNDVLGLPKEDLDEATKRCVAMVENGWNPFTEVPKMDELVEMARRH